MKITPYLKQYVAAKLALGKKIVTTLRPNPIIALVAINPLMVVIQVQVGKNMVEDVILHGRSSVNIMVEELWKRLWLLNPQLALYTL